jgi:hypothetical protein
MLIHAGKTTHSQAKIEHKENALNLAKNKEQPLLGSRAVPHAREHARTYAQRFHEKGILSSRVFHQLQQIAPRPDNILLAGRPVIQ